MYEKKRRVTGPLLKWIAVELLLAASVLLVYLTSQEIHRGPDWDAAELVPTTNWRD